MDEFRRLVIKQGNGIATVPPSADHRNGDWIATDIYQGELYLDLDTGLIHSRSVNGITLASNPYKVYITKISQTGTSAPTVTGGYSQLTGTLTFARSSAGVYSITNSVAEFTANNVFIFLQSGVGAGLAFYQVEHVNSTLLNLYTFNYLGAAADSLLLNSSLEIKITN